MAEPLNLPPGMEKTSEELLSMAESFSPFDVVVGGIAAIGEIGPGMLAGIMQAFQDASTSECDCGPCITLREMVRGLIG